MSKNTAMLILVITMQLLTVLYIVAVATPESLSLLQRTSPIPVYVVAEVTIALWILVLKAAETED